MSFLQRKKQNIRVPTGRDAVNFRKLLFLPASETQNLLSVRDWNKIDFRCLTLMKNKVLRAACLARGISTWGWKKTLVQKLTKALEEQKLAEFRRREEEELEYQRHLDMLGGVWTFGTGNVGQLGHGDLESDGTPRLIKKLRGRGVSQVYAGFDSDAAFAVTRSGDVYVWGKRSGPVGLPQNISYRAFLEETDQGDDYLDDEDNGEDQQISTSNPVKQEQESTEATNQGQLDDLFDDGTASEGSVPEEEDDDEDGEENILEPVRIRKLCGENLCQIAVGRTHCCARSRDGDVFTWGQNDHCQLGMEAVHQLPVALEKKARTRYGADCLEPALWERTVGSGCPVDHVAVGPTHTFVATNRGEMLAFGATFTTTEVSYLSQSLAKLQVAQVTCGAAHAGLVTTNGQAYTWGNGDGGRLGHGNVASCEVPKMVESLKDDFILELSCACWHTVAIVLIPPMVTGGLVYTWGSGRLGQLAQGGKQMVITPALAPDFLVLHVLIKTISAGMYHNAALSVDGEVFTWGSNVNGCLGRPEELAGQDESFCAVPGKVENMEAFIGRACSVACGREFTLIATKPYLGPSREEIAQKEEEEAAKLSSLKRQHKIVQNERRELLDRIRQDKVRVIVETLNQRYPRCSICTHGTVCPGFQPDPVNPGLCKHCLHDRRKHDDRHPAGDYRTRLPVLYEMLTKLELEVDFSSIENIEMEEELGDEFSE